MSRAAPAEPAAPESPPADTSPGPETPPSGDGEAPQKPTPISEGTGTPPEVSEAARRMAARRSELRAEAKKELEAEGAIKPGELDDDEAPAAEAEDEGDEPRPPTATEEAAAEAVADHYGPMAVEDPAELPDLPRGFEWVEIPAGNPLRDRGDTHFPVASGPAAEYIKSQLNNPIRNREVEQARAQARELQRRMAEYEARQKARESEQAKSLDSPEIKRLVEDMRKSGYSEGAIETVLSGVEAKRKDIEEQAVQEVEQEQYLRDVASGFVNKVEQIAEQRYKHWTPAERRARLAGAYQSYGNWIDAEGRMPNVKEFFQRMLDADYASDPRVNAAFKKESASQRESNNEDRAAERERLKQEIRDELLKEAEARRSRRSDNPLGRFPPHQSDTRTPRQDGSEEVSGLSPGQVRKSARDRAMSRYGT